MFYPPNLDEGGDLGGHPGKRELALKKAGRFRSMRRNHAKTSVRDIFYLSFKGLRLPLARMQRQLAAAKPSTR